MRYGEKFKRLLQMYPHPEGRPWKGVEIEQATHGFVNSSYISSLKAGHNNRPGLDKLRAISEVMGFPFELWLTEPDEWKQTVEAASQTTSGSVADKLNYLFESIHNEWTGEPFSGHEVAVMSQGRLSEAQVQEIRAGQRPNPGRNELLALCDVFDVDFSYWDDRERPSLLNPETLAALRDPESMAILHKSRDITRDDRGLIMTVLEELERRRTR